MTRQASRGDERTRGALTLFALARMARAGPVHGYGLSAEVEARTGGAWRPGPGAIYPALDRLVARGLAYRKSAGRRMVHTITPAGRRLLSHVRARASPLRRNAPDLSALWSEVMGVSDPGTLLLVRLRRAVDGLELHLGHSEVPAAGLERVRREAIRELRRGASRLAEARDGPRNTPPGVGR